MGREGLTPPPHPRGFRGAAVQQGAALCGPVHRGPVLCDPHMPRARERLRAPEDVRRPLPLLRVIDFVRLSGGSGERLPGLLDQLPGGGIHASPRARGSLRRLGDCPALVQRCHQRATGRGRNAPQFPPRGPHGIFLRAGRPVSWLLASPMSHATAWSARSRRVPRACPAGGSPPLSALRRASPSPSKRGGRAAAVSGG